MFTNPTQMLMLLNWMSPNSLNGNLVYSNGLEQAIKVGQLRSPMDVESWIKDMLEAGSAWNDAVLFARCWHDNAAHLEELAQAIAGSAKQYDASIQHGRHFWDAANIWFDNLMPTQNMALPVVAGSACAAAGMVASEALLAYLQSFVAAQVSVASQLGALSQTKGQEIMKNLAPVIVRVAERASRATLKEFGPTA